MQTVERPYHRLSIFLTGGRKERCCILEKLASCNIDPVQIYPYSQEVTDAFSRTAVFLLLSAVQEEIT